MPVTAYVALGSNLGDRRASLDRAVAALRQAPGVAVTQVSSVYETAPVGGPPGQGPYLNAVLELQTERAADDLLHILQGIESDLGRVTARNQCRERGVRSRRAEKVKECRSGHDTDRPAAVLPAIAKAGGTRSQGLAGRSGKRNAA